MDKEINKKRFAIPSAVSSLRIVCAFVVLYFFFSNLYLQSILLFLFACGTDILDGVLARKLGVTSSFGAYFDATADCCLIIILFSAFVINNIYPFWVLIIIGFMFLQFILTSKIKHPIYDPIGRYCGVFFFVVIGTTLIFPYSSVFFGLLITILSFSAISLISRYVSLYNGSRKPK